ncbi:MAG: hypothetical protein ACXIUO_04010 [Erythrobacter sp.]
MEWLTYSNVTTGLIAFFTGLTGIISWRIYSDQKARILPAIFLETDQYDNGLLITVTIRNRNDHAMRVNQIKTPLLSEFKLVSHEGTDFGNPWDDPHIKKLIHRYETPKRIQHVDMTLGSAGRDSASGSRSFVLHAKKASSTIEIIVSFDLSDGRTKPKSLKRRLKLSNVERESINEFGS